MPVATLTHVAVDPHTRQKLQEADWADIGVRLTAHAVWKAQNFHWRTRRTSALAAGKTPEDIAREAILKVLDGTRAWEPERGPLLAYLQRVVDSLMSHLAASSDNALLRPLDSRAPQVPLSATPDQRPPTDLIESLRVALSQRGERDLLAVLDAAAPCGPKPSAIALRLGTTVTDVNNRLKRLRRIALGLLHTPCAPERARRR